MYKHNECLPKEYLEKVNKYFDDSQITNVNMIQILIKQMAQKFAKEVGTGNTDTIDMQSLMGVNR